MRRRLSKRIFDILFSLFVLISLSPIYLALALSIKCSSKGPIFYISRRIGLGGKLIRCFKFRTMYPDADFQLHHLLASNKSFAYEWATFHKLFNDPRVTPIGRFLRKTSLDELPQFFNVLLGDLSVVGPRGIQFRGPPEMYLEKMYRLYGDKTPCILSVRPGITGLWQISGRNLVSFEERKQLDILYATEYTLWQDILVICKTIPTILCSKGAF